VICVNVFGGLILWSVYSWLSLIAINKYYTPDRGMANTSVFVAIDFVISYAHVHWHN